MKIWETLVGVREDLPTLRQKWWHKLAIIVWFVSAFVAFFVALALLNRGDIKPDPENTFMLSLPTFAKGRPGQVVHLTDLGALRGVVGTLANNELTPLGTISPTENVWCEAPARLKARQTISEKDRRTGTSISYTAIPDYEGQPNAELRHCAASPAYASLVAQQVVSYRLNGIAARWRAGRAAWRSLLIAAAWLIVGLNIYHRGIITIWAARRRRRIRKPEASVEATPTAHAPSGRHQHTRTRR